MSRSERRSRAAASVLYWALSLTWGILPTLAGLAVLGVLVLAGKRPSRNGPGLLVEAGGDWGGISLGPVALSGKYSALSPSYAVHVRRHEFGHSLQNCLLGPFFLFLVALPSVFRWHWIRSRVRHGEPVPEYDSAWFEGQATLWGTASLAQWEGSTEQ